MTPLLFIIMIIKIVQSFDIEKYIYGHQLLICENDMNFNSSVEQRLITSEIVNEAQEIFNDTKISIKGIDKIECLPKLQTYKTVFLPKHSLLCSGHIHIEDSVTQIMISEMPELSLELPNIVIIPHKIIVYDNGPDKLDGLADYGGAFLRPIKEFPKSIKMKNIILVSSSIIQTDGARGLLQLFLHEIAHTFALEDMFAYHDPDDESYQAQVKGTYILSKHRLTIQGINNFRFSPQTISMFEKYITKVFWDSKYNEGWQLGLVDLCGNGIVDRKYGEQCECFENIKNTRLICDCKRCRLKTKYQCIEIADRCCTPDGQIAKKGTKCRTEDLQHCLKEQYCNGKLPGCSESTNFHEGTKCGEDRICSIEGTCISKKCHQQADDCVPENTCMFGCKNNRSTDCVERYSKKDGSTCIIQHNIGQCIKGVCSRDGFPVKKPEIPEFPTENENFPNPHRDVPTRMMITAGVIFLLFICIFHPIKKWLKRSKFMPVPTQEN